MELLRAFESAYERFNDPVAHILMVEIIVDLFRDQISLQALCRLTRVKNSTARALAAHGLAYFAKKCDKEVWSGQAFKELLRLSSDPAEPVREEATAAIARLKKRKPA